MMRVKIIKKNGKSYVAIPFELPGEELELFELREGFYLLAIPLERVVKSKSKTLSKEEINLLIKVSLIRFAKRTLKHLFSELNERERRILKSLIKRGIISVKEKKNEKYITFSDELYEKLKEETKKRKKSKPVSIGEKFFIVPKEHIKEFLSSHDLSHFSYVSDSNGTLYVADKKAAKPYYAKIVKALKKGKARYDEIAQRANMQEELAIILLKLMAEEGIVYEPEKGIFELVE